MKCNLFVLSVMILGFVVNICAAQQQKTSDLLTYYLHARTRQIATDKASSGNLKLTYLPLERLDTKAQVIQSQLDELSWNDLLASLPEPLETFGISSIRLISRIESGSYATLFSEADWSFMGSTTRSAIDTMKTADIRARLEYHYGAPTQTLAEIGYPDSLRREDVVEFEYWFLANGTIPVTILDVNGPWDRGIVLAAEMKYRSKLDLIKKTIFEQLTKQPSRKQFVDYYYNIDQRTWYLTGFDGVRFFDQPVKRPDLKMGRPSPALISERNTDN
ncbi:hypothetical protein HQ496_03070 [bacterium]|nr:hypothetical protein [bacterium]